MNQIERAMHAHRHEIAVQRLAGVQHGEPVDVVGMIAERRADGLVGERLGIVRLDERDHGIGRLHIFAGRARSLSTRQSGQQGEHTAAHLLRGIAPLEEVFLLQLEQRALHFGGDRQHGGRVEERAVGDAIDAQARLSLRRIEERRHAVLPLGTLVRQIEIDRKHAGRRAHREAIGHADGQIDQPVFPERQDAIGQLKRSLAAQ